MSLCIIICPLFSVICCKELRIIGTEVTVTATNTVAPLFVILKKDTNVYSFSLYEFSFVKLQAMYFIQYKSSKGDHLHIQISFNP